MQLCLLLLALAAPPAEDLQCLKIEAGAPAASTLFYDHLRQQAYAALDKRQAAFEQLKSPADIQAYQARLRELIVKQLGGFPERTPLNAQVVGKLDGDGYCIEKVIFESQPRHHVTANLYLPLTPGPHP